VSELESFCSFCERVLTTEVGRPFVIERFQREFLADHFDGRRELVVWRRRSRASPRCWRRCRSTTC
jgi:hypothetical protein